MGKDDVLPDWKYHDRTNHSIGTSFRKFKTVSDTQEMPVRFLKSS